MRATLSMIGLYNWDPSIFDTMELPAGLDRDTVISAILLDSMDLEVLYPDPEYMKYALANYSKRRIDVWNKLYATTKLEYNPIWNKDGTITETENVSRTGDTSGTSNTTTATSGKSNTTTATSGESNTTTETSGKSNTTTETNGSSSGNSETDTYVFGFNESTGAQSGRTTESGADTSSGNSTENGTSSGNSTENGTSSENRRDDEKRTYTRSEQGNIGVTTTQQMIKEEREVDDFSIIDYIAKDILHKMCILVY